MQKIALLVQLLLGSPEVCCLALSTIPITCLRTCVPAMMMLSDPRKSSCPFCGQLFTRLGAHLSRCKERQGRDYASYLAKHPLLTATNQRGRCPRCSRFFKRLDKHFSTSATCKHAVSPELDSPCTTQPSSLAMNTAVPGAATPAPQPQPAATVCVANEPSTPSHIQLFPPFLMPQPDEDWEADNTALGSTLVHQVLAAQSVDDKNMVLCAGIYNYFTLDKGTRRKSGKKSAKKHNRAFKRLTQDKNRARRELRAVRREGKEEGIIKEVARRFHQLIRLHSKAKKEQMRSRLNLEAGKARQECARSYWKFAAKVLDGREETPEPAFSAEEGESFFKKVYSSLPKAFQRPAWLPVMNAPKCAFNDDPISISEICGLSNVPTAPLPPVPSIECPTRSSRSVQPSCLLCWTCTILVGSHKPSPWPGSRV